MKNVLLSSNHPFSGKIGLLDRLDPRSQVVGLLAYVISVVSIPMGDFFSLSKHFILICILIGLVRVSISSLLKKCLVLFPFVILVAAFIPFLREGKVLVEFALFFLNVRLTEEGLILFFMVSTKAILSFLTLTILMIICPFPQLLKALQWLKIPRILVVMLSMLYRYLFIIRDEAQRMMLARNIRYFGGYYRKQPCILGNMVGSIFIRTYERAERVYGAMLVRGYQGRVTNLQEFNITYKDFIFLLTTLIALISIHI
jgi:cobalt/nickel transport system permease protein